MERILKILDSSCYPTTAMATTKPCSQVSYLLNPNPSGAGDLAGLERDKLEVSPEKMILNVTSPQTAVRDGASAWVVNQGGGFHVLLRD